MRVCNRLLRSPGKHADVPVLTVQPANNIWQAAHNRNCEASATAGEVQCPGDTVPRAKPASREFYM